MFTSRTATRSSSRFLNRSIRRAIQTTLESLEGRRLLTAGALVSGSPVASDILGSDNATSVIFDANGRVIVGGQAGGTNFGVARYLADGVTLDNTFSGDGKLAVSLPLSMSSLTSGRGVVTDPTGNVYIGGFGPDSGSGSTDFIVAKSDSTGAVTSTSLPIDIGSSTADQVSTIVRLAGGEIIAVGSSNGNIALARFNSSLALTPSGSGPFSTSGIVTTTIAGGANVAGAAVDADGNIVVAATQGGNVLLLRYLPDGTLDTTFNGTGQLTVAASGASARAVSAQADNQIVVVSNEGGNVIVRRVAADGLSVSSVNLGTGSGTGVTVQAHDQRIAVSITASGQYKLTRLNTNLSLNSVDSLSGGSVSTGSGVTTSGIAYYEGSSTRRLAIAGTVSSDFGLAVFDANINPVASPDAGPHTVTANGTRTLTNAILGGSDSDDTSANVTFTVNTVSNGYIALASNPGLPITSFTLAQVLANQIVYKNNGTLGAATFTFTASDNFGGSDASSNVVNFNVLANASTVYVDDAWAGMLDGTSVSGTFAGIDFNGSAFSITFSGTLGVDAFSTVNAAYSFVAASGTISVLEGLYKEDVSLATKSVTLRGTGNYASGATTTELRGMPGGDGATVRLGASGSTVEGLKITRAGDLSGNLPNVSTWNDLTLNSAGVAVQGLTVVGTIRNNYITGNRTGIDLNNVDGITVLRNNIDDNRTGMLMRNAVLNSSITQNFVTDNWTGGIVVIDGNPPAGNPPFEDFTGTVISGNDISGNWYEQIENRSTDGGAKNFSGNWLGDSQIDGSDIAVATSTAPGYAAQIPVAYGGLASNPGGAKVTRSLGLSDLDFTPYLNSGTDTAASTPGFQGSTAQLNVTTFGGQTGATGRINEAIAGVDLNGIVQLDDGTYDETVLVNRSVTIDGRNDDGALITRTSGSQQILVTIAATNVTVEDIAIQVNQNGATPIAPVGIGATAATTTDFSGLVLDNNTITSIGSAAANWSGSPGLSVRGAGIVLYDSPSGGIPSVTITNNDISILSGTSFFQRAVWLAQLNATITGNNIAGFANDLLFQFPSGGASTISSNQFNGIHSLGGGGLLIGDPNGGSPVSITNNQFNTQNTAAAGTALQINRNAASGSPITVSGNTFTGFTTGVDVGGAQDVSISGNTFTPKAGATGVVIVQINSQSASNNASTLTPINTSVNGNTFNTNGASVTAVRVRDTLAGSNFTGVNIGTATNNTYDADINTGVLVEGGVVTVDESISSLDTALSLTGGVTTLTNTTLIGNTTGVSVSATGTLTVGSGNSISGGTTGVRFSGSGVGLTGLTLGSLNIDASGNYIELLSGSFDNLDLNGQGLTLGGVAVGSMTPAQFFAAENKLVHEPDDLGVGFITLVPNTIFVTPATSPTPTDNDYTRINNAVQAAGDGWTINLQGTFNWAETNAANSWASGSDYNIGTTADNYEIKVPGGLNGVTFTASGGLGSATIQGPGDLANANLEAFLEFDGGSTASDDNQNWTISNLIIQDFDLSLGFFNSSAGTDAFNGTTITNNSIRVPADLNAVAAPADVNQNIGIHFSFGTNQTISNNTIEIVGSGLSNGTNFSSSVGMQSNTSGGTAFDGLLIDNNTINVTGSLAAQPSTVLGIWENGHAHQSDITVSNNDFFNLTGANQTTNLMRAFRVTSHSGASTTVLYNGNTVSGANIGFQWITGSNFTGNQPVVLSGNSLTNVGTGFLVQSNGLANLSAGNSVNGAVIGIDVQSGSVTTAGTTLTSATTGISLSGTGSLTVGTGNTISGGTTGVLITGSGASLGGNSLGTLSFTGSPTRYVTLASGAAAGLTINAAAVTFDGVLGGSATNAQSYAIEDRIDHKVDALTLGLVSWRANHLFVTQPVPGSTDSSIQRGIDAAPSGAIVHVQGGALSYNESPTINKSLTLAGDDRDTTTIALLPTTTPGTNYLAPVLITGSGNTVTLSGFTIVGNSGSPSSLANTNVYVDNGLTSVTITANRFKVGSYDTGATTGDDGFGIVTAYTETPSQFIDSLTVTGNDFVTATGSAINGRAFFINTGVDAFVFDSNTITGDFSDASVTSALDGTISNNTYTGDASTPAGSRVGGFTAFGYPSSLYGVTEFANNTISYVRNGIRSYGAVANIHDNTVSNSDNAVVAQAGGTFTLTNNDLDAASASDDNRTDVLLTADAGTVLFGLGNALGGSRYFIENHSLIGYDLTGLPAISFEGINKGTLAGAFAIENRLFHGPDDASAGLLRVNAGQVYVTTPGAEAGISDETIQNAINVASAGDTVNIQAGTYSENVTIGKDIDLLGDLAGGTTLTSSVANSKLITILGTGVFGAADNQVSVSHVNLDGATLANTGIFVEGTANLGTLIVSNADIGNTRLYGIYVDAAAYSGSDPSASALLGNLNLSQLDFANNGTTGGGGTADIQLFGYNNNATLSDLNLVGSRNEGAGTGARGALQIRGIGTASGAGLAAMGNVSLTNVDISGSYRNTMISVQRYSTVSTLSLSGVKLGGGTSALTGTFGAVLRFDAAGSGTVASPATVDLGDTLFRGLTGSNAYNQVYDIEFAPDNGFAFLRADARDTQWTTAGNVASGLSLADAYDVEDRILHYVDKLHPTHFAFGGYRGYAQLQDNKVFVTDQASVNLAGEGSIQRAVQLSSSGYTVHVDAGTYTQDVIANVGGVTLLGSGAGATIIEGAENNGNFTTLEINQPNITVAGFTITRTGNSLATWNDGGLNNQGVAIYSTGTVFRDNIVTGNRNGIYIDGGAGNVLIRNNIIEKNRTGIHVYQVNGLNIAENYIRDNWTLGLLFRNDDVTNSTTGPITVFNNSIYGNYYGGLEQRWNNTSVVINAAGNWWGTSTPLHVTNGAGNAGEPGYASTPLSVPSYIPGGTGAPVAGAPDILESNNPATLVHFAPYLTSGVDTNISNYSDTYAFQGDFSSLGVSIAGPSVVNEDATTPYTLQLSPDNPGTPTITGWIINWGDGSPLQTITGNPITVTHLYPDGTNAYAISATASTTFGTVSSNTINVTVNNVAPSVAITGAPLTSNEGASITLGSNVTDPALSFDPLVYSWNVTKNGNPFASGSSTGITFTPDDDGTYVVTLTVNDGDGGITTDTKTITVGNLNPSITINTVTSTINENSTATIVATVADAGSVETFSVSINWADANSAGTTTISGLLSSGGVVTGTVGNTGYSWDPTTRQITLTHVYSDDGATPGNGTTSDVSNVSLTVSDDDGGTSSPATTAITVNNVAPTSLAITPNGLNVYDEGQTLNFVASALDNLNDTLSYSWSVSGPGGFSVTGSGTAISFTAPDDGVYTFSLTVADDDGGSTVLSSYSVTVADVAPRVVITSKTVAGENSPSSVTFYLVDPGAGDLASTAQVSITWGDGSPDTVISGGVLLALLQAGSSATVTHTYNDNPIGQPTGSYPISFGSIQFPPLDQYPTMALGVGSLAASLQVNNLNPTGLFVKSTPAPHLAGNPISVNWLLQNDPSPVDSTSLHYTYGVDPDAGGPLPVVWVFGDGSYAGSSGVASNVTIPGSYFANPGTYNIVSRLMDKDGGFQESVISVLINPVSFRVNSFTANASGFDIVFNRDFDRSLINLYSSFGFDPADVVVTGPGGVVTGSLVFTGSNSIAFVATGGILANGTYSVTLRSASNGFRDTPASSAPLHLLDGNNDNVGGDNYSTSFSVANSGSTRIVSIPDFARGPGQIVQVPAGLPRTSYLPIQVNAGANIGSLDVQLRIDPTMLTVTNASFSLSAAATLAGWTLTVNQLVNGDWTLVANGVPSSLSTASLTDVIIISATVPSGATYGASEVIRIISTKVSGITAIGDNAVHAVAYVGDADGTDTIGFTGRYSGNDASLIRRVAGGLDTGFSAYPTTDPGVIADVDGIPGILNALSGNDASIVAFRAANFGSPTAVPQIPAVPGEVPTVMAPTGGTFAVPSRAAMPTSGSVTVVPMRLSATNSGALSAMFTVELPAGISLTATNGVSLTNAAIAAGVVMSTTVNEAGQLVVVIYSTRPLPTGIDLVNVSIRKTGVVSNTASIRFMGVIGASSSSEVRVTALRKDSVAFVDDRLLATATAAPRNTSRITSSIFSEDPILS